MELTNLSYIQANDRLNSSHKDKNLAISRLSTGNRLNKPGLDAGALSVSMKLSSNQEGFEWKNDWNPKHPVLFKGTGRCHK